MKIRRLVLVVLLVAVVVMMVALLLFRIQRYESDTVRIPTATPIAQAVNPPSGVSGVRDEAFGSAEVGFVRAYDQNDSAWRYARNVQVRGKTANWSDGLLTVSVGGGTLERQAWPDRPVILALINDGPAVRRENLLDCLR